MIDQENKCIKLQEDYQELVKAKGEFDGMLEGIQGQKTEMRKNMMKIKDDIQEAKIKKQEIKNILETFTPKIIREIIEKERKKLSEFFGEEIIVPPLPEEITKERIEQWTKQGFELHYLPKIDMLEKKDLKTWKKKATDLFKYIARHEVNPSVATLTSGWILIDGREIPAYEDGKQMYKDKDGLDVLGKTIEALRKKQIIADYKIKDSRFNISCDELGKEETKEAFAKVLGVKPDQMDLPGTIECNVIVNIHHYSKWGDANTRTCEWFKDTYLNSSRLDGGLVANGWLSKVSYYSTDCRYNYLGFRLLVRFF